MNAAFIDLEVPLSSNTRFYGLISLWIIFCECMYYKPRKIHAAKNRVCCSVNLCFLQMWYLKSPPGMRSITKYKVSLSWKACLMLIMNLFFSILSRFLSFLIDSLLFLARILDKAKIYTAFDIYFIAKYWPVFFSFTLKTFPKPPLPITCT
jgi:hypothetical protein